MSRFRPEDLVRGTKAFVAERGEARRAEFGVPRVVRTQAQLDRHDWQRPARLSDGSFVLPAADSARRLVEVVGTAELSAEDTDACVVARDRARVWARGSEVEVWAFGSSRVSLYGGAVGFAYDRAHIDSDHQVYVHDQSHLRAWGLATVSAFGRATVVTQDCPTVTLCEQARVVLGAKLELDPLLSVVLHSEGPRVPMVFAVGPATVELQRRSDHCVLVPFVEPVIVGGERVPASWWAETQALTEDALANVDLGDLGDPLPVLRGFRARFDVDYRYVEASGRWRPIAHARGRSSPLSDP
jgi:hypothetical protein